MTFGAKLKQLREAAGISQADLAFRSGLHPQSVAKLEQGARDPSFFTVKAIAQVLGVSVGAFEGTVPSEEAEAGAEHKPAKPGRPRKAPPATESPAPADAKPARKPGRKGGGQ